MAGRGNSKIEWRLDRAAEVCARAGTRLTEVRRAVLSLLLTADAPVTAYTLLDRLKGERGVGTPPTIYRALNFLLDQGLVHKVERLNAFVPCADEAEHRHPAQFLICSACGGVTEVEDTTIAAAVDHAARRSGFRPTRATVEVEGTCASCISH